MSENCVNCGQFVSYETGYCYYTPDSDYSMESTEWLCQPCGEKERQARMRREIRVVR
jgi:hypothetical protein